MELLRYGAANEIKGCDLPEDKKANPIGIRFIVESKKRKDVYKIVDITTNTSGEVVKRELLCEHVFIGQVVKSLEPLTKLLRADIYEDIL